MADAGYVIDIAAEMPEGAATQASLDALAAKLTGGGKAASYFSDAIGKVDDELSAAKATQAAAAETVRATAAEYKALERAATDAQKAADKAAGKGASAQEMLGLQVAVDQTSAALGAYEGRLTSARAAERAAARAVDGHAATLANIKSLQGHVAKGYEQNAQKLEKLSGALRQVGGPLGNVAANIVSQKKALGELSAVAGTSTTRLVALAGVAAVTVAAVVALTIAVVAGTIALAAWAVGLANTARDAGLAAEAYDALHPKVAAVRGEIDALWASTGVGTDVLQGVAEKLTRAGVSGDRLKKALGAAATAEVALGNGGSEKFVARMMAGAGAVDLVAREIDTKLGGIATKRLMGLTQQGERLKKRLSDVFGGLNIEPVLRGVARLVGLFDTAMGNGRAMQFLFERVFQPLIDKAEAASLIVEAMFLGFQIAALKVYIGLKPLLRTFGELFGFDTQGKGFATTLDLIVGGVEKLTRVAIILGIALAVPVAILGGMLALIVGIPAAITIAVVALGDLAISALKWVGTMIGDLVFKFVNYDWAKLGTAIVDGIVNGLTRGARRVWDAMTSLADMAMGGAEKELEIASPSKRAAKMGDQTAEGYAQGVERNEKRVRDASQEMVKLPAAAKPGAGGAGTSSGASGSGVAAIDLRGVTLNLYGIKDAEHGTDMLEIALTRILEGDALSMGGGGP